MWPYLTCGDLWATWQGERSRIDAVAEGECRVDMPDGAFATGTVVDAEENERLVLTWGWTDAPFELDAGSTTVKITLERVAPDSTRLVLTHSDLPVDLLEHHRRGWERRLSVLGQLAPPRAPGSGEESDGRGLPRKIAPGWRESLLPGGLVSGPLRPLA